MRVLAAILTICLLPAALLASTIHVPDDYTTIQAGIDAAVDGDTVLVGPGTYAESLTLSSKDILLTSGSGPAYTFLEPVSSNESILSISSGVTVATTVSGFTFRNTVYGAAVYIEGGSPTIEHNVFQNNRVYDYGAEPSTLRAESSAAIVRYNLFDGNGGVANIYVDCPVQIYNNTIVNSLRAGIIVYDTDAEVMNNIVIGCPYYGIIDGTYNPVIDYNDFYGNDPDYLDTDAGPNDISADPLFVNSEFSDYSLALFSPCIDAGNPAPFYNDPDGTRNDMGAYPRVSDLPLALGLNFGPASHGYVVHTLNPQFYWTYFDTLSTSQIAYEIEVGTDPEWDVAELWSSGIVSSSDTTVVYSGAPLENYQLYCYRIRVDGGNGFGSWVEGRFLVSLTGTHIVPSEFATIQSAIELSVQFDTVLVLPGTYSEDIDFLGKSIVLISLAGPDSTILEQSTSYFPVIRCDSGEDSNAIVQGFTIQGTGSAPGVFCSFSSPVVQYCDIHDCHNGDDGGGILCLGSGAKIRHNRIWNNSSGGMGGGISAYSSGTDGAEIVDNELFGNTAVQGPGIGSVGGYNRLIDHNLVYNNSGGGNYNAGIYVSGGSCAVLNNTVVGNSAGIYVRSGLYIDVRNNIVAGNAGVGLYHDYSNFDYNDVWGNGDLNDGGPNGLALNPEFVGAGENPYALSFSSPCVNAGDPDPEYADPDGTIADIGAFYNPLSAPLAVTVTLGDEELDHVVSPAPEFHWSYFDLQPSAQAAYEIEVGTDPDWSAAEMWVSGQVFTSDTFAVYNGATLEGGEDYFLRIRVSSDETWGSWIGRRFHVNARPAAPVALWDSTRTHAGGLKLGVFDSQDVEGDSLTYDFTIYYDSTLIAEWASQQGIVETPDSTYSDTFDFFVPGYTYWWRARSFDSFEYSDWSEVAKLTIRYPMSLSVPAEWSSIQSAIDISGPKDTVLVGPGTYTENLNFKRKHVMVIGEGGRGEVAIEPAITNQPIVTFNSGEDSTSVLQGVTLRHATSARGIYCEYSDPLIQDCEIYSCIAAGNGGAVYCKDSSPKLLRNFIHDNYATGSGAGIFCSGAGESVLQIRYNEISHNYCPSNVPGIYVYYGVNSLIDHNLIYANYGSNAHGWGLWIHGWDLRVLNNTIVGNSLGLKFEGASTGERLNNIVAYNLYGGVVGADETYGYNDIWNNNVDGLRSGTDISEDPLFVDAVGFDLRLQGGSPCIDAGDPDPAYNDPDGSRNDIGALYFEGYAPICGDANGDQLVNVTDGVFVIYYIFSGGPAPSPLTQGDFNCDLIINVTDVVYLMTYIFAGGPEPCAECPWG